ncbi:copper resistance CopC family protein [Neobacillus sp. DY30]|uniref:copper resistance CopC family protein n=1 Tax=Neobacillus sp. DY30 TaxID=3047871 RepID=UPI0024C04E26|nr:copper resistance CopC family protein [Neobacillus sp. DY30]WHX98146.1 copper resistance protein CopC [Neobacillus sp. DY30]
MKKIIIILFSIIMIVPTFVSAHTSLSTSNPSEGQVVTENLEQIILTFATTIEELSTMELVKDGNVIPLEGIKVEQKHLMGTVTKPLENGSYKIQWKIVGEDGHPIKGEINFVVQIEQNGVESNPVTPEDSAVNQGDDSQTDQGEEKSEEQNIASDAVENTDNQNNNLSSIMFVPFIIILIIILGIVLLFFTKKKKS